jgi:hypothetical protein
MTRLSSVLNEVTRICIAASSLEALRNGHRSGPGHRLTFLRMPGVNRQGQAHIVSTAIRLPRSYESGPEVGTWFSIDPQPASISPTVNISIVFICAFPSDCGQVICHPAIKNDSSAILPFFEIARVLVCHDHITSFIVKRGSQRHVIDCSVFDCIIDFQIP